MLDIYSLGHIFVAEVVDYNFVLSYADVPFLERSTEHLQYCNWNKPCKMYFYSLSRSYFRSIKLVGVGLEPFFIVQYFLDKSP